MPDWRNYYFSYNAGTSGAGAWVPIPTDTTSQIQQQYQALQQEDERYYAMMEQGLQQEERDRQLQEKDRREERENFPLFFWKETCKKKYKVKKWKP